MELEADWLEQARAGSKDAFARLVTAHHGAIRAYLGRFSRDRAVVDDLAQDVFIAAWRSLAGYAGDAPLRIWLFGIAQNRGLKHLRDSARRRLHEGRPLEAVLPGWLERTETEDLDRQERTLTALRACLGQLPPHSARIVDDYYFKGRTTAEIADETGRRRDNVWVVLMRIRQALRDCVQGRLAGDEA